MNNIKDSNDISKIGLIIIGNKCDLPDSERKVTKNQKSNETNHNMKI